MNVKRIADALRALADAIEAEDRAPTTPAPDKLLPAFMSRKTARARLGLEVRAFDRAAKELGAQRPGREWLLETEPLVKWIRDQRAAVAVAKKGPEGPVPFPEEWRRRGTPQAEAERALGRAGWQRAKRRNP